MKIYTVVLLLLLSSSLLAQQSLPAGQNYYDDQGEGIIYNKEFSIDMKLLTPKAIAIGVNIGQLRTYYKTRYFNIELGDLRHTMEVRDNFDFPAPSSNRISRSFIYAKQNSAYVLRTGWGIKQYLSEKAKRKGLAIGFSYQVGPELAILKPYYLELRRFRETQDGGLQEFLSEERFSEENASAYLDIFSIYGGGSFSKGLGDLSLMPGISAKAAVHFAWGAFDENVKAMEVGIMVDAFFKDVPIMVEHQSVPHLENSPLFVNLYISLQLGKRR